MNDIDESALIDDDGEYDDTPWLDGHVPSGTVIDCGDRDSITSRGSSVSSKFSIDISGMPIKRLVKMGIESMIIRARKPWSSLTPDEHKTMIDGSTIHWTRIGKKVKSREENITDLMAANTGMPKEMAEYAIDNPLKFAEIQKATFEAMRKV